MDKGKEEEKDFDPNYFLDILLELEKTNPQKGVAILHNRESRRIRLRFLLSFRPRQVTRMLVKIFSKKLKRKLVSMLLLFC